MKDIINKLVKKLWIILPFNNKKKQKLKNILFKTLGILFKNTSSYQSWQHSNSKLLLSESKDIPTFGFSTTNYFTDYKKNNDIPKLDIKAIAFYLPQFHPFPENDQWWGKGFTEWYNVGKALPNYKGHYQPHCPIHVGYYDLRIPEVMEEQVKLAKNYGIEGFNYYFYWFNGTVLMERPLEQMLNNKTIDMPFCLTWANENWSRRWDGAENDILIAQKHSNEDSIAFLAYIIKYFKDDRYIKVNQMPILCVYRADIIPNIKETTILWRNEIKKYGFKDLYLICFQTFGLLDPREYGFDAAAEFPPHKINSKIINETVNITNSNFKGNIYSYDDAVQNATNQPNAAYKLFRAAMLSWDNTARKQDHSHIFANFSLTRYQQWLDYICHKTVNNQYLSPQENLIFINAWNEWAEGTHLEPDRKLGYSYLQSTYNVLSNFSSGRTRYFHNRKYKKNANAAVIIHIYYQDLVDEILSYLENFGDIGYDVYITSPHNSVLDYIYYKNPSVNLFLVENRGRDILPFILVYKEIAALGYSAICKIHSKKSLYKERNNFRSELFEALLGSPLIIKNIVNLFEKNPNLGIICPTSYLHPHTDKNCFYNQKVIKYITTKLNIQFEYSYFPSGSMFWFRPDALSLLNLVDSDDFPLESGFVDGTTAHAIERLIIIISQKNGYSFSTI